LRETQFFAVEPFQIVATLSAEWLRRFPGASEEAIDMSVSRSESQKMILTSPNRKQGSVAIACYPESFPGTPWPKSTLDARPIAACLISTLTW